ncbi:hypothetical protein AB0I53_45650, partial [Saccharopolyspora sp. NPDC050389]|uniref:hypothetical protein n=1 Tax=Saccharopolyspora sp. NPDC050389 TaxID=3155516 RepID=UPI0033FC39F9
MVRLRSTTRHQAHRDVATLGLRLGHLNQMAVPPAPAEPAGSLFSGSDQPGHGWYWFRRDRPAEWIGHRYPAPGWEKLLPRIDIAEGGLSLVPIPAGLMVRRSEA